MYTCWINIQQNGEDDNVVCNQDFVSMKRLIISLFIFVQCVLNCRNIELMSGPFKIMCDFWHCICGGLDICSCDILFLICFDKIKKKCYTFSSSCCSDDGYIIYHGSQDKTKTLFDISNKTYLFEIIWVLNTCKNFINHQRITDLCHPQYK